MSCIEDLLRATGAQFEPELKRRLSGLLGGIVRAYLPQLWVFRTEHETVSLRVDAAGRVTVTSGAEPRPDVTIEVPHDRLATALRTRDRSAVPAGPLTVTPHTAKGKTAFDYLRSRLGI
jgi:hypothetical protein